MPTPLPPGYELVEGVADERYPEWLECWLTALGTPGAGAPAVVDFYRRFYPPQRAIAIYDERGCVTTNISLDSALVLPGGATVPLAAGTGACCHPTLTRRGLSSVTLDRLHRRAAEEGKALFAGTPTEWPLHQRVGYGPATWYESAEIEVRATGLRDDTPGKGIRPYRIAGEPARDAAHRVYTRQAAATPGEVLFPAAFWDRLLGEPCSTTLEETLWLTPAGAGPRQCAVIEDRGFVSYRIASAWTPQQAPDGVLHVIDFLATDIEAAGALWRHLFSIDLISEIHVRRLPTDDPLRWWVDDARRIRTRLKDGLWLRVMDVPRLLEARTWSSDGVLTLRIHDDQGYAAGTYRLEIADGKGTCTRTTGTPDLDMDVSVLGSILLGGTSAASMERSGRLRTRERHHALVWDAAATPERAPFLSYWF
jgi:predicted acetyltransferase